MLNNSHAQHKKAEPHDPCVWVISDMHLEPSAKHQCDAVQNFLSHLCEQIRHEQAQREPGSIQALYLLGDLFEAWIGDDAVDSSAHMLAEGCTELASLGVQIYLQQGNRDFLMGEQFAKKCHATLLPEYCVKQLFSQSILFLHGDQLCTDDTDYIKLRAQLRSAQWQEQFLSLPIDQRRAQALHYRQLSTQAQANKTQAIMDVNEKTCAQVMEHYKVNTLIHGHTHRPALHHYKRKKTGEQLKRAEDYNKKDIYGLTRAVLGSWHDFAYALKINAVGMELLKWPLTQTLNQAQLVDAMYWHQTDEVYDI